MKKKVLSIIMTISFVFGMVGVSFAEDNDVKASLSPRASVDIVDGEVIGITDPVTAGWLKGQFDGDVVIMSPSGEEIGDDAIAVSDSEVYSAGEVIATVTVPGDVNKDGRINITDVSSMLKRLAKWDVDVSDNAADLTNDGKANLSDVSLLLKYLAGWDVTIAEKAMLHVSFDEYVFLSSDPAIDRDVVRTIETTIGKDVTVVTKVTEGMKFITVDKELWNEYDFMDDMRTRALFPENSYIDTYGGNIYLTASGDEGIAGCAEFLASGEEIVIPRGYTGTVGNLTGVSQRLYDEAVKKILAAEKLGVCADEMTEDIYTALVNAEYTEPKNIIYMIGDGMGTGATTSAEILHGSELYEGKLSMKYMPVSGMSTTFSAGDQYTDSAAGGTALATGYKTTEGILAMSPDLTENYTSLLELADELDMSTGVIATSSVTDATPAAFTVHVEDRDMRSEIARQQLSGAASGTVDLIFGGGYADYDEHDVKDAVDDAILAGVTYTKSFEAAKDASLPVIGLFGPHGILGTKDYEPSVSEMTEAAINKLSENENGFFLMVEGSEIDGFGHENNLKEEANQLLNFDRAVAVAMKYAALNPDTVVIVTADHETGGLVVPPDATTETIESESSYLMTRHHWVNVPVYAVGYGVGELSGFVDNTHIARFAASIMGDEDFGNISEIKTLFDMNDSSVKNAFSDANPTTVTEEVSGITVKIGGTNPDLEFPLEHIAADENEFANAYTVNVTYRNMGNNVINLPGLKIFSSDMEYRIRDWCIFLSPGESITMSYVFPTGIIEEGEFMPFDRMELYGTASYMSYLQITDISVTCYDQ